MATIEHILNELQRQRRDIDRLLDDTNTSSVTTQELVARIEALHARSQRLRDVTLEAPRSPRGGEARPGRQASGGDAESPQRPETA